jgi:hypothetical protein
MLTQRDAEDIQPFLPENPTQIVDLCRGTGWVSIAPDKLLLHGSASFWLVDGHVEGDTQKTPRH